MATLTENIYEKLMGAVNDPVVLETVLHEYSHSKGPLYVALAKATTSLLGRFKETFQKCEDTDKYYQDRQQQIKTADEELTDIGKVVDVKTKELSSLDTKISGSKALLDEAKMLAGMGFDAKELAQLHELLSKMAASQGAKPQEAKILFFKQVGCYQDTVALELEVKGAQVAAFKAKADMERWQAEATAAEAKCKARKTSVDFADKLIAQGVKQTDLPRWSRIISKAGVKPEKLANALEQYGSLEKFYQHRQKEEQKLEDKISGLTSQVKALSDERQQVGAAIGALRKEALAEIEKMSQKTLDNLKNMAVKSEETIGSQQQNASEAIEAVRQKTQAAVESISKKTLEGVKKQLDGLLAEAMRVGGVIGEMNAMVKKGEDSGKTLNSFMEEVAGKVGRN